MFRKWTAITVIAAAGTWGAQGASRAEPWQFAGENHGIRFALKIANECRTEGARLRVRLENASGRAVTVSFRIVDPEWNQSFERDLAPGQKDTAIEFEPDDGTACHPYVDEVYVEDREGPAAQADGTGSPPGEPSAE